MKLEADWTLYARVTVMFYFTALIACFNTELSVASMFKHASRILPAYLTHVDAFYYFARSP